MFNRADSLEETIKSVLSQKYNNVEYIVIDGGSTDDTVEILKRYNDSIAHWISEPDKGIYDAMNKGIGLAKGDWINFMNCGDRFASPDVLNMFEYSYDTDIVYGNAMIEYHSFQVPWPNIPVDQMWKRTPFCHQACFVKAAVMKKYKFDLSFRLSSDFDFLYKAWLDGNKFAHVDRLICYYDNKEGASKKYELRSFRERRRAVMTRPHTFGQWFYYVRTGLYLVTALTVKGILGERLTTWITRLLKG